MGTIKPIKEIDHLKRLLAEGYLLKGPRQDISKNLMVIKRILGKGRKLVPEDWLINEGYRLVEPSAFTKGMILAYRIEDDILRRYFKTNYSLLLRDIEIPLYLKYEE